MNTLDHPSQGADALFRIAPEGNEAGGFLS